MAPTSFPLRHNSKNVVLSEAIEKNNTLYSWDVQKVQGLYYVFVFIDTHLDTIEGPMEDLEFAVEFVLAEYHER